MSEAITILCAAEDQDALSQLMVPLRRAGFGVATASDADAAVAAVEAGGIGAVVAAHDQPGPDGLALLERLDRANVPVFLCPASGDERLAGRALAAGAAGYVPRCDADAELVDRIRGVLGDATGPPRSDGDDAGRHDAADEHNRLSLLIEQSPLAIVEWTTEFTVDGWNPAAEALFGFSTEEVMGRHGRDLLVPETERETVDEARRELLEGGGVSHVVNENVTKDGDRITCEWHNTPLTDEDGEVVGALSFVRDVTDRTQRVAALETLQEMSRDLIGAGSRREVAAIVTAAAADVLLHPLAAFRLHDAEADALVPVASADEGWDAGTVESLARDEGPLWRAFGAGQQVVYEDTDEFADVDAASLLVQPLGEHGVLSFAADEPGAFDETDRYLATVVGAAAETALDRTERKHELERRERLLDAVGDGLYALDTEGYYTEINDAVAEMTGYDREELLGEHVSKIMLEADIERGEELVQRLLAVEDVDVASYEVTVVSKDGERIPCEVNMSLLPGEGFSGSVGTVRDISERKRMERTLRDRKRKIESVHRVATRLEGCRSASAIFELAVEAARDVFDVDACTIETFDGAAASRYVAEDSRIDPAVGADGRIDRHAYDRARRRGETVLVDDLRRSGDGAGAVRSLLSVPVGDVGVFQAATDLVGSFDAEDAEIAELLLSHVANAVERVRFETELREERDRFAALFENVPDPVVSTRRESGRQIVLDVNAAFERVFGYDGARMQGEPLDELIVPPDEREHADELAERGTRGELVETEVRRRTATGYRDFVLTVVPVDIEADSSLSYGVYTDVTEHNRQQQRVEVLNRVLRHDLRNGMNIVKGCAEMLDAMVGEGSEYAAAIQERADELIALAEKTRAVERTLDRDDAEPGSVDVVAAIDSITDRVDGEFDVDVTTSLPDSAYALADSMLRTAIYHVVENAIVHNDGDRPSVNIDVTVDDSDERIRIVVADDGPGIPDEERELLAEDREITQLRHASGLGLWLVNWVVTQSGGELSFDESPSGGTRVVLEIPRARVEQRPA
ncbi:PAS domain S-box protein [Natronoarchaeum rubrum]|uniref:PAS domain S-box protein n=1 Tax=Natronoarchaeum rubrum TaxID=755311 RepID=UPI002111D1A2|nr:PAS domain S-box protein [Natronoarchaeum rubrum]